MRPLSEKDAERQVQAQAGALTMHCGRNLLQPETLLSQGTGLSWQYHL
jgi:hypothetical protein